jgi:ribosomal protein L37E
MIPVYLQCRKCARVVTSVEMAGFKYPSRYQCCNETSLAPMASTRYECSRCGAVSHNAQDAAKRYCARCHEFA